MRHLPGHSVGIHGIRDRGRKIFSEPLCAKKKSCKVWYIDSIRHLRTLKMMMIFYCSFRNKTTVSGNLSRMCTALAN
jgi:hypothetical protein